MLGIQTAREREEKVTPPDAQQKFDEWCISLKHRLELADLRPIEERDVQVIGSKPIARRLST